jgi:predicted acylesterase/phospholipase RssA
MYATSAGSIILVIIALNFEWDIIDDYLIKRPWNTIYKMGVYSILDAFNKKGLFDIDVIKETFLPLFKAKDISIDMTMLEFYEFTKIELHIIITDMNNFESIDISYKTHPDWKVIEAVYCSSAIPIFMSPYFKDSKMYYDGGILMNYPIDFCLENKERELEEIISIKMNNIDNIDITEEDKTIFDYLLLLFLKILLKISKEKNCQKLKNEIRINSTSITFEKLYNCLYKMENRQTLIEDGIKNADAFLDMQNGVASGDIANSIIP